MRSHGTGPRARPRREGPARDGMPVLPFLAATRVPRSGDRVVVGQGRAGVPSLAGLPRSGGIAGGGREGSGFPLRPASGRHPAQCDRSPQDRGAVLQGKGRLVRRRGASRGVGRRGRSSDVGPPRAVLRRRSSDFGPPRRRGGNGGVGQELASPPRAVAAPCPARPGLAAARRGRCAEDQRGAAPSVAGPTTVGRPAAAPSELLHVLDDVEEWS